MNRPILFLMFLYLVVQLVYAIYFPVPFISDSANYIKFAHQALAEQTYYPNPSSIYNSWIVAPVYINYLVALLSLSDGNTIILISNVAFNMLQLALVFIIARKLYGTSPAMAASVVYMLYLVNTALVLLNFTELMFGVFILLAIYFYISDESFSNSLLCGVFVGLSIGVRPTGFALVLVFIFLYVISIFLKTASHRKILLIGAGLLIYIIPMGLLSARNINRFEYASTTGPANLIMSLNPTAQGVYSSDFVENDSIYKTLKTYPERDKYLKKRAMEYFQENPGKWFSLIPRKIYSTFIFDGWGIEYLLNSNEWNFNTYLKGDANVKEKFRKQSASFKIGFWVLNIWQQMIYTFIMLLFFWQLIQLIRNKFASADLVIFLIIVGGVALSIVGSIGNARYKYNFMILAIVVISPLVVQLINYFAERLRALKKRATT